MFLMLEQCFTATIFFKSLNNPERYVLVTCFTVESTGGEVNYQIREQMSGKDRIQPQIWFILKHMFFL